jgi:nucleoside-diphosphate-sugar epimerase
MRTLVTGASGFIGAHMAKRLLVEGHDVVSIAHDQVPSSTAKLLGVQDKITWCYGDVRDEQLVKRVLSDYSIDQVYHFAALPIVEMGMRSCRPMFEVNFMGTLSVLEALREATVSGKDVGLMYVSTDKYYGPMVYGRPYKEEDPSFANAPYELSKSCADMTVRMYHNMDYVKNVVVVRPCNQYGPADLNPRIIPNTIRRCLKGQGPIIYDGVTYTREFIFVEDTVDAMMFLTEKGKSGEAYNLGTGEQKDQKGVVSEILKYFPTMIPDIQPPKKYTRKEIPYQVLDSSKLRGLGWEPKTRFDLGIMKTVVWWEGHKELW